MRTTQSEILGKGQSDAYELQVHNAKPECLEEYIKETGENLLRVHESKDHLMELVGSWTTLIGSNTDQVTHLWRFPGYDGLNQCVTTLLEDKEWQRFRKSQGSKVISRSSQILLSFTYWPAPEKKPNQGRIFEMRSYDLTVSH